ncbi:hypothetical protein PYW08_009838 [Mythimna loreyi]|uniref:Uncharacterized protein n=1 Tax=Mythimna loreyi TaxID=667449 RepID=A0ACC2Q9Q7_9NEOP|nr:hypothetical protein PYW08_009838 [Mythimna loreyi]
MEMESHVQNTYHQAPFYPIGHGIYRKKDYFLSSVNYNQSSPNFLQKSMPDSRHFGDSNTDNWDQNEMKIITQMNLDIDWDFEDPIFDLERNMTVLENNIVQENVTACGDDLDKDIFRHEKNIDYNDSYSNLYTVTQIIKCCQTTDNIDIIINDADVEVMSSIKGFEDYFIDDMTSTNFSHIQTSTLFPRSPVQLSDLDFNYGENSTEYADNSENMPEELSGQENSNNMINSDKPTQPEIFPSNHKSSFSRYRSCRKKVVYHCSSDEEVETKAKNIFSKKKTKTKSTKHQKKQTPPQTYIKAPLNCNNKSTGSIRLTIKNKSEVILHSEQYFKSQILSGK